MEMVGNCHICGKPATETCRLCGQLTCSGHLEGGVCSECRSGRFSGDTDGEGKGRKGFDKEDVYT